METRCWALLAAAGVGSRMGSETPKQYLPLRGRPIVLHSLERLLACPEVAGATVVVHRDDRWWAGVAAGLSPAPDVAIGGEERRHSVLNGLERLAGRGRDSDWVLVHDAARPCVRPADVSRLIAALREDPVGGILAVPVGDTIKRATADGAIAETVAREGLWHAQTPQMFRLGPLRDALRGALDEGAAVTDEAQAMERAGLRPRVVEGHADNVKITRPEDVALAEVLLERQEATACG